MAPTDDVRTPEDLADLLCALVETACGPGAPPHPGALALSLEAAHHPDLRSPQRAAFVGWAAALLRQVGARHPEQAARTFLACGNGLLFHRLTVESDVEVRPVIERCLRACLD
jgi:hypothetical protein